MWCFPSRIGFCFLFRFKFRQHTFAAVILALSPLTQSNAHACSISSLGPSILFATENWEEFTEFGRKLLSEVGRLSGVGISVSLSCSDLPITIDVQSVSGSRRYTGMSSRGSPLDTVSNIETFSTGAEIPFKGKFADFSLVSRIRLVDRTIRSQGPVIGYPERFEQAFAGITLSKVVPISERLTLQLALSRMIGRGRVKVDLPGSDPADLTLGNAAVTALSTQFEYKALAFGDDWKVSIQVNNWLEKSKRGEQSLLYQGTKAVGIAYQPEINLRSRSLIFGISRLF